MLPGGRGAAAIALSLAARLQASTAEPRVDSGHAGRSRNTPEYSPVHLTEKTTCLPNS